MDGNGVKHNEVCINTDRHTLGKFVIIKQKTFEKGCVLYPLIERGVLKKIGKFAY